MGVQRAEVLSEGGVASGTSEEVHEIVLCRHILFVSGNPDDMGHVS